MLVERRISSCCVQYECVCPLAACPVLAECDSGVQPVPMQRGHGYPGFCCPQYQFEGVCAVVYMCECMIMWKAIYIRKIMSEMICIEISQVCVLV